MEPLLNAAFECVRTICMTYRIDESHAMKHSMEVLSYTIQSFKFHEASHPYLQQQQRVLYAAAIVHDMCDKKYMNEEEGLLFIHNHLYLYLTSEEINHLSRIITTLSYSTVRTHGFPQLYEWQLGYHIVREADLLASYDIHRCVLYGIYKEELSYCEAFVRASTLYSNRVLRYIGDGMFVTEYGHAKAHELHARAVLDPTRRFSELF
jgi:hypothetical protein